MSNKKGMKYENMYSYHRGELEKEADRLLGVRPPRIKSESGSKKQIAKNRKLARHSRAYILDGISPAKTMRKRWKYKMKRDLGTKFGAASEVRVLVKDGVPVQKG